MTEKKSGGPGRRVRQSNPFWKASADDLVDAELDFHLAMRERDLAARGTDPAAAHRLALARFGDLESVAAECRELAHQTERKVRKTEYLAELTHDARFALRQLAKAPGFATVAILTLALGIGATTAIFSAVEAVVLRRFAYAHPERTVLVNEIEKGLDGNVSAGNYVDWAREAKSFAELGTTNFRSFNLAEGNTPERVPGAAVSASFFRVFGVPPLLGRAIADAEDQPGQSSVVVLSEGFWRRRFGADSAILGRSIRLDGEPHTVIGVMPESFDPLVVKEQLWVPIAFTAERRATHDEHYLNVVGLLKPDVTMAQANREMGEIMKSLAQRFPIDDGERGARVVSLPDFITGPFRARLLLLLGSVVLVLLIACGNVANLLLARSSARAKEMAIRAAIGAGRGRIVRQLLAESFVLALLAAGAGLLLARAGIAVLVANAPRGVPRLSEAGIDVAVILFAFAAAVVSAVLSGLAPAVRLAREDLQATLREGGRNSMSPTRDRVRTLLVAAEVALALTLLTGAGLLIRSSLNLGRVDPGFEVQGLLTARIALPARAYKEGAPQTELAFRQLVDDLGRRPGVLSAAATSQAPMGPGGNQNGLIPEGRALEPKNAVLARLRMVTPGYFATLKVPLRRGRLFTDDDKAGAPRVMIVSEALARSMWPGEDPVGKRVACCEGSPTDPKWKTVVGVAGDVRSGGPMQDVVPEFYLPVAQVPAEAWDWIQRTMTIVVRGDRTDPATLAGAIRAAARTMDPSLPVYRITAMRDELRSSMAQEQFNTGLLTILGVVGLLLAAVGIYSVIAYFVTLRSHEIGVRMALGATGRDVVGLLAWQGMRPILVGVVVGGMLAAWGTRLLHDSLFGVDARDPLTFGLVALLLIGTGFAATVIPAIRATRVDPTRALQA